MSQNKYQLVEDDYNAVDLSFHNSYNTIDEYHDQVTSFLQATNQAASLLNIGGTVVECSYFADQHLDVTNIDLSQAMLDHISQLDDRINIEKGNIIDYEHAPFDAIWACRSLIHIPPEDFAQALKNIKHLLAKDGVFGCIFFTSSEDFKEEYLDEPNTDEEGITYYRVLYNPDYLATQFTQSGFHILKQELCTDRDGEKSVYFELS